MRHSKFIYAPLLWLTLTGFTFDYEVLSECENKHPNDFLARLVCNGKVERRNAELNALTCVKEFSKSFIYKNRLFDFLNENADEPPAYVAENLDWLGLRGKPEIMDSAVSSRVIVFTKVIPCKTEAYMLFNLRYDDNFNINSLGAWVKYPNNSNQNFFVTELSWFRYKNIDEIEKKKEIRKALEEAKNKIREENLAYEKEKALTEKNGWGKYVFFISTLSLGLIFIILWKGKLFIFSKFHRFESLRSSKTEMHTPLLNDRAPTSSAINKLTADEINQIKEFRAVNAYVNIDVPPDFIPLFAKECEWYKRRVGVYPGINEQKKILNEIKQGDVG